MLKKISGLFLSLILLMTVLPSGVLADDRIPLLASLGIFEGYEDGSYRLENNLTRAEFTKVAVAASRHRKEVSAALAISPFADVPHTLWSAPYIHTAVQNGYVVGYLDSTFRPDETITFAEATAVLLRLLGYQNADFGAAWPKGHMEIARDLSLTDGVTVSYDAPVTRGDIVTLLYNLLEIHQKGTSTPYLSLLDCTLTEKVLISATQEENLSPSRDKIVTSAGTFKKGKTFSKEWLGKAGKLYIENGDTIVAFVPDDADTSSVKTVAVYSVLGDSVVTYKNGNMEKIKLSDGIPLYKNNTPQGTFTKSQLQMGDILEIVYDTDGEVSYVTLNTDGVDGPYTAKSESWSNHFALTPQTLIMRDGQKVSRADIAAYDILYYSRALDMVFAYTDKITGVYKNATPSKDTPSSVNISGTTYTIEGLDAFHKLSGSGTIAFGDTVTILLGRNGGIADVIAPADQSHVIGFVTNTGITGYSDTFGETYSSYSISVTDAGGKTYAYEADKDYSTLLNRVVSLTFSDGKASAVLSEGSTLGGKVDAKGQTLGDAVLSPSVKILDTYNPIDDGAGSAVSVFLPRLDGVNIPASQVLYAERDAQNRISALILKDVTGDMHDYGVVTRAVNTSMGMSVSGSYSYISDGTTGSAQTNGSTYPVHSGAPARFSYVGGKLNSITPLTELPGQIEEIGQGYIRYKDGSRYDITGAHVYTRDDNFVYTKKQIADVETGYTLRAFYDKSPACGGAVRILLATKNRL